MRIGFIGSGNISKFHLVALRNNNFSVQAIGSRKNSLRCKKFAEDNELINFYCKGGWEEVLEKDVDAFSLCIDTSKTPEVLFKILDLGKPVLVEKPVAWNLSELDPICNHVNSEKVFVAYNRRFYKVVNYAKEFCDRNEGGSVNINIPDSKQGKNRFLSNGCHIIDLARYILGDFEILKKIIRNNHETNEMEILTALCSNQKWSITINAHSLIPANFGITINSKKEVFELLPIEKFSLYEGLEIIEPNDEYPLRRYLPKIVKTEFEDSEFKPGFNNMYRQFYQFIKTNYKKTENSVTINEARSTLKKCIELIN